MPSAIDRLTTAAPENLEDSLRLVLSAVRPAGTGDSAAGADGSVVGAWSPAALVALLGFDDERADLAGSAYARVVLGDMADSSVRAMSEAQRERCEMTQVCRNELWARGLCTMTRTIDRGGLIGAVAVASGSIGDASLAVGCALVLPAPRPMGTQPAASVPSQLFHEAPGRVLLAIPAVRYADATLLAASHGVPLLPLGRTGGRELVVRATDGDNAFREVLRVSVAALCPPPGP